MIEAHPMTSEIQSDVAKPVLRAACFISRRFRTTTPAAGGFEFLKLKSLQGA
jgi:hypothetical protein